MAWDEVGSYHCASLFLIDLAITVLVNATKIVVGSHSRMAIRNCHDYERKNEYSGPFHEVPLVATESGSVLANVSTTSRGEAPTDVIDRGLYETWVA